jgi:hypothetical protein
MGFWLGIWSRIWLRILSLYRTGILKRRFGSPRQQDQPHRNRQIFFANPLPARQRRRSPGGTGRVDIGAITFYAELDSGAAQPSQVGVRDTDLGKQDYRQTDRL